MFPRSKFSITSWATVCTSLLLAAIVSRLALAQQTTAERVRGSATVSTSQVKGEVVQVEGNDLLVKLSTDDLKTFHVPETRKFHIDGKELSVHDLQPGTTLTATVKTTRLKGHDAWQFYYEIEFAFSDRSRMKKSCSPVVIGENDLKVCPL